MIESLVLSSSLQPAFISAKIYAFRSGGLLVFFRLNLDRRKLQQVTDQEVLLSTKSLLLEHTIKTTGAFDNLIIDSSSVDVREYGDHDWSIEEDTSQFKNAKSLTLGGKNSPSRNLATESVHTTAEKNLERLSKTTSIATKSGTRTMTVKPKISSNNTTFIKLVTASTNRNLDSAIKNKSVNTQTTQVSRNQGVGYAEWKPIDLPQAIQISNLGVFSPTLSKHQDQPSKESITLTSDRPQSLSLPPSYEKAIIPTLMSSVSLVVLPNSKNKTVGMQRENTGIGMVKPVDFVDETSVLSAGVIDRADISAEKQTSALNQDGTHKGSVPSVKAELTKDMPSEVNVELLKHDVTVDLEKSHSNNPLKNPLDVLQRSGTFDTTNINLDVAETLENHDSTVIDAKSSMPLTSTWKSIDLHSQSSETTDNEDFTSTVDMKSTLVNEELYRNEDFGTEDEGTTLKPVLAILLPGGIKPEVKVEVSTLGSPHILPSDDMVLDHTTVDQDEFSSLLVTTAEFSNDQWISVPKDSDLVPIRNESAELRDVSTETQLASIPESNNQKLHGNPQNLGIQSKGVQLTTNTELSYSTEMDSDISTEYSTDKTKLQSKDTEQAEVAETTVQTIEQTEVAEKTVQTILPEMTLSDATTIREQFFRFGKVIQSFAKTNPNDVNSGDDLRGSEFLYNLGFPSTLANVRIALPTTFGPKFDNRDKVVEEENVIQHISTTTTTVTPSGENENVSQIVGLGKHPTFHSNECLKNEVTCGSGECVPEDYLCNMRRDCRDNSDESNCTCSDYLSIIGQSQKICDGVRDCWDLSDENSCPWCSPGQYLCPQSKFCVNTSQVCDGANDCPFGTDERYCVKLAHDAHGASSTEYYPEGYLMVRKSGKWGKLCVSKMNDISKSNTLKLHELGSAVCSSLTYRGLKEATKVQDNSTENQAYYEITTEAVQQSPSQRSSAIFEPSECKTKDVVHVKCNSLECGLRPLAVSSTRRRIVGGQSTGSGSWPWQVALYKEGEFQCGAVLVSPSWLLSAGHCFYSTQKAYWSARLGILRRGTELRSPSEEVRRISRIILHPDYIDKGFINDMALLQLEEPVAFSDYLRPLCLPFPTEDVKFWHGQHCSVVGWGKLFEIGHTFPDSLQEVRLPLISTEECRKRIVFLSMYHITDNMFCAGYDRGGRDACLGDSGGPLMCQRQDGRWVLLGITSNGDGCGRPGRPGVYTKVTQYLHWINQITSTKLHVSNSTGHCSGHRCPLGRCVQQYRICDGRFDCADGSDEMNCSF